MAIISLEPNESFEHYHGAPSRTIHLDGEIEFAFGDTRRRMREGETIEVAANITHTMRNVGTGTARVNCVGTSGQHGAASED